MPSIIGVIGGSGFYSLGNESDSVAIQVLTPFSDEAVVLDKESIAGRDIVFLTRHGKSHGIPPHKVNYRANLKALQESGVEGIIAINVVGGITKAMAPGCIVIPDQIIDYTWGRQHTYFDELDAPENHIDFSWPYDLALRTILAESAVSLAFTVEQGGVYGCTQGPRLESAAEILRLKNDGCDIVGMTAMPEAALARELKIPYASIALVVNWAAGLTDEEISFADISSTLDEGIGKIRQIILSAITALP
ncbi:MAG: S-methyl-5'-thioinosine phosphorylase [Gammaproteobacteria bacterium]|jgi:5'-methylthioinosine phosphorylase|nr:S-methyl-5'-thioinosine phosphorylase [Gammaproteobacteria bacterium]